MSQCRSRSKILLKNTVHCEIHCIYDVSMPLSQQDTLEVMVKNHFIVKRLCLNAALAARYSWRTYIKYILMANYVSMPLSQQDTLEDSKTHQLMKGNNCLNAALAARYSWRLPNGEETPISIRSQCRSRSKILLKSKTPYKLYFNILVFWLLPKAGKKCTERRLQIYTF